MRIRVYEAASAADAYAAIEDKTPGVKWKGIASAGAGVGDQWLKTARLAIGGDDDTACMIGHSSTGLLRAAIARDGKYAIVWKD